MAELIGRLRPVWPASRGSRGSDLLWWAAILALGALVTTWVMTVSLQAAVGLVLVVLVVGLHQHDRRLGIGAMFALWFAAPLLRRLLDGLTGYVNADPLSVAPIVATAAIAGIELLNTELPTRVRRTLTLAATGFIVGLPIGMLHPASCVYTVAAYFGGLLGAVLGFNEGPLLRDSTLRWVLLIVLLPVAIYGILQRVLPLPSWDQSWLKSVNFNSIGTGDGVHVRVFASLNAPGTLAALLGWALLCYLTARGGRLRNVTGATVMILALALTYVRAAWLSLAVGALAYVIASRGRATRVVFGSVAVIAAATVALSPVSHSARSVLTRATSFTTLNSDASYTARSSTLSATLPSAVVAPLGHGLGSAGEQSKINNPTALQTPDDGYLSLIYQIGPVGFILVMAAIASITASAWRLARAGIGGDLSVLLFAMIVFTLALLTSGDAFYGVTGVLFWFMCGQVLGIEHRADRSGFSKIA